MAKATKAGVAAVGAAEAPVEGLYILVEEPNGGEPYRVAVGAEEGLERAVTVGGVRYEHCGEWGGRWVYRAMAF